MASPLALYTAILALAVTFTLALAAIGLTRRDVEGSGAFVGLVVSGACYAFGSIFEIRSSSVAELQLWLAVEYLGIANLGPSWLVLARQLAGKLRERNRPYVPLLFVLPAVIVALVATNGLHQLFYSSISLERHGPFTVPRLGKGPIYWVNMAYMNACILGGTLTALARFRSVRGVYRRQAVVQVVACLVPWTGMALYQSGISPWGLDIAPIGVAVSGAIYAWGLFRHQLFDLSPVFHENVFEGMGDGVLVIDLKGRLVGANPAMRAILPELSEGRIGEPVSSVLAGHPVLLGLLGGRGSPSLDTSLPGPEGPRHFAASAAPMRDRRGRELGSILTLGDITARVELAARLEELASVDPLTGVLNRRRFLEDAAREFGRSGRSGSPLALAVVDLDHFKAVNDRHGHQAGDQVLVGAVAAMRSLLRATDLLGRYGGEEFVLLFPDTGPREAEAIAERLRAGVAAREARLGEERIHVTASFGLACREGSGGGDLDSLLAEADAALYEAKAAGRNRVVTARPRHAGSSGGKPA